MIKGIDRCDCCQREYGLEQREYQPHECKPCGMWEAQVLLDGQVTYICEGCGKSFPYRNEHWKRAA